MSDDNVTPIRTYRPYPPRRVRSVSLHPSVGADVTDTAEAKLARVVALLDKWDRATKHMSRTGDRELIVAAIQAMREAIAMPPDRSGP